MAGASSLRMHLDQATLDRLLSFYADHKTTPPNEYISDFFRTDDVTVAVYFKKSKDGLFTVTFQGKNAAYEASIFGYVEPEEVPGIGIEVERKFSKKVLPQIGSDEVGTGDYFGPIVVTACYLDKEGYALLRKLGVTDSKLLSDDQIRLIGPKLIHSLDYSSIAVSPLKYNSGRQEKGLNMNAMKAVLHNQALINLAKRHPNAPLFQDQFAEPRLYFSYLKGQKEVARNIHFSTKGELAFPSVAAASCIARYHFLRKMETLAKELGVDAIPLGAGEEVDAFAAKHLSCMSVEERKKFVKLNFANTKKAFPEG